MLMDWKMYYKDLNSRQQVTQCVIKILVDILMEIGKQELKLYVQMQKTCNHCDTLTKQLKYMF